jgi:hypothetical protein
VDGHSPPTRAAARLRGPIPDRGDHSDSASYSCPSCCRIRARPVKKQSLSGKELQGVIEHQWVQLGLDMTADQPVDTAVLNAIARVTGGNFRLVQRLFAQIERIVTINHLPAITTEVVTLARERLVEGAT